MIYTGIDHIYIHVVFASCGLHAYVLSCPWRWRWPWVFPVLVLIHYGTYILLASGTGIAGDFEAHCWVLAENP